MRLSSLVDDGVLRRELYQSRPKRFEYLLTDKGRDLFPIVLAIKEWGARWGGDTDHAAWRVEHIPCRNRCSARVVCDRCTEQLRFQDARVGAHDGGMGGMQAPDIDPYSGIDHSADN